MQLKTAISQNESLNRIINLMQFHTPMGRMALLQKEMMTDGTQIDESRRQLDNMEKHLLTKQSTALMEHLLIEVRDIHTTLFNLSNGQRMDEIALFEIKAFALTAEEIRTHQNTWPTVPVYIPSLNRVIAILDPDGQKIKSFYIYDGYSQALMEIRRNIQDLRAAIDQADNETKKTELQQLLLKSIDTAHELEGEILTHLSQTLLPYAVELKTAMSAIIQIDILLAQKRLNNQLNLKCPVLSEQSINLTGLFHPIVKSTLEAKNQTYQPVSISIKQEVTLITGANMSGKSILLQSIALAQLMFQYGFYVPAASASMMPVFDVILLQGDMQNSSQGLSSFGAEVIQISQILKRIKDHHPMLILLDEPARTTNPIEGEALVDGLIEIMQNQNSITLMATHYGSLQSACRRLKTKGLKSADTDKITLQNIHQHLDYALEEIMDHNVPHEAIRIASILGGDAEWLSKANENLKQRNIHIKK